MPSPVKKKGAWILLVAAVVLVWGVFTLVRGNKQPTAEVASRKVYVEGDVVAPSLPLKGMAGTADATFAAYTGRPVLLNFWAGWCAPCLKEMPSLYRLQERYGSKGLAVLAFNMDEAPEDGLEALERIAGKPTLPLFVGYEQEIFRHFPVEGLPFTVLIDRNGKVVYAQPGERDWIDEDSRRLVEGLL